ncbi:MAG: Fic family protein [Planctomycetes bacterium]|nr:Fic family protein [Planctomycetota bacterium]
MSEYLGSGRPVTEALIRELHRRLVEGVRGGQGHPGAYRTVQNYVARAGSREVVYMPPPPTDVPPLMRELVTWIRGKTDIHPVLVAGIAQFQLVHIHPFVDGNGRTSRLLSTLCLYREGYDFKRLFTLSEFYDRDRAAFSRAIQDVREHGLDLTGWLEFFVGGLATQLSEVMARGEIAIRRDVAARKHRLNLRQAGILDHLLTNGKISLGDMVERFPRVNRRSLRRDFRVLLDKGLLKEVASSPTDPNRHYVLKKLGQEL